jgi:hypothetical protein
MDDKEDPSSAQLELYRFYARKGHQLLAVSRALEGASDPDETLDMRFRALVGLLAAPCSYALPPDYLWSGRHRPIWGRALAETAIYLFSGSRHLELTRVLRRFLAEIDDPCLRRDAS